VTRVTADAPSTASSPMKSKSSISEHERAAWAMVARRRTLATAARHYREAMVTRLTRAMDGGLDPRFVERALTRVIEERNFDQHLAMLREALRQARADQLAGMCPSCGIGPVQHSTDCPDADAGGSLVAAALLVGGDDLVGGKSRSAGGNQTLHEANRRSAWVEQCG